LEPEKESSLSSQNSPEPRGLLYILLYVFGFVSFWFFSKLRAPVEQSIGSSSTENNAYNERNSRQNVSPSPTRVIVERFPPSETPKEEWKTEKKKDRKPQWGIVVVNVLTLGAIIVYAVITGKMWREMRKQTRNQADASINAERAWLGLDGPIKIEAFRNAPPRMLLISNYRVKNFGHGPAFKAISSGWFSDSFDDMKMRAEHSCESLMDFTKGTIPVGKGIEQPPAMGRLLFREQGFDESIGERNDPFSRDYNPKLQKIWFTGCITYRDQFESTHWTRFCMTSPDFGPVTINEAVPLHYCNLYNDTDEPEKKK